MTVSRTAVVSPIVWRWIVNGIVCGTLVGLLLGTILYPVIGTIIGAICGAIGGFVLGFANGLTIGLVTSFFFIPLENKDDRYFSMTIITSVLITMVGSFLIFNWIGLYSNAIWGVIKRDSVEIQWLIVPIAVTVLLAVWRGRRIAAWHIQSVSNSRA